MKITGNTVGTTMPRSNYNQTDPKKADYIVGRENILSKEKLQSATEEALRQAKESGEFDGAPGISPTAKVEQTDGGAVISVTDASGTTTASIANGKDGKDGAPGAPGVSPVVTTKRTDEGVQIEVTDASGETSVTTVYDGADGKDGTDGYTPEIELVPVSDGVQIQVYGSNSSSTATVRNGTNGQDGIDGTSPTVAVSAITGGNRIAITDVNGTRTVDVMNGEDGKDGNDGTDGADGKSAYAYAVEGGYTGTEAEFAERLAAEMPEKLPNPHTLTINGVEYDGSEAVDIEITGGSGGGSTDESSLWGQTPYTLSKAEAVRLVGGGDHTYNIKGVTVADLSTVTIATHNAKITEHEDYIEITATGGNNWYESYANLTVSGLTVGTKYVLAVRGLGIDEANGIGATTFTVKNANGTELGKVDAETTALNSVEFTADTSTVTIIWYTVWNYYWTRNCRTARISDFYINEAVDGTTRTEVIHQSGEFTDTYVLGKLSAGVTITSTPSCYVYKISGGESAGGSLPLEGKTVVCFGDSLFGMYTGDTSAPAYVAKRTGATVQNVGFGGCRMSVHPYTGYNEFCMYALAEAIAEGDWSAQDAAASKGSANFPDQLAILKEIDFGEVDYIVIHYGTNDFNGAPIDNTSNKTDYTTLCGALRYSVEKLLIAYPKLRIFVSLPAFRYWTAADGSVTYSDTYQNGNGHTLVDFVEALRKTAEEYNLPVIDSYYGLGINKVNASAFLADGVHHNIDGRKRFGEFIGASIVAENTGKGASVAVSDNGGSAQIDVTAEAGQTIVVEEVDENGNPTKWRAADYQPRTHWRGSIEVLAETACVVDEEVGAALLPDMEISAGDNLTVVYNGTEYACTCADLGYLSEGMLGLGNYGPMVDPDNPVDTGEPFVVAKLDAGDGTLIWCCIPIDASAAFTLSIIGMGYHAIPQEYLSNSFPYYIDVSGIGTNDDPYTCNERVSDVNAVYESGRSVIVRLRELNQVNGYTVWTFYHLNAKMEMFDKTVTMYTFARPMPTNARQELLYLIAQNDGTFGVTDSFGE